MRRISIILCVLLLVGCASGLSTSAQLKSSARTTLTLLDSARNDIITYSANEFVNKQKDPNCDPLCKQNAINKIKNIHTQNEAFSSQWESANQILAAWNDTQGSEDSFRAILKTIFELYKQLERDSGKTPNSKVETQVNAVLQE